MPVPGFNLTVTKTVTSEEVVQPEMWQLSTERGEVSPEGVVLSPTRIIAIFRPTNEDGTYRTDVEPVRKDMVDLPNANDEALHDYVTIMRKAMLKAVVPNEEPFIALGVAGLSVELAGPILMAGYFSKVAAEQGA